jgi:hypothetical protein
VNAELRKAAGRYARSFEALLPDHGVAQMSKSVGVTGLRYVQHRHEKGQTYYYFRRRHFPMVRLPGEPGSELFMAVYNSALKATTLKQFNALRSHMRQHQPRNPGLYSPSRNAIMAWAKREPITLAQATMVAKLFGVPVEDIVRSSEIVDDPKN